jgi:hypothetical protein
VGLYPIFGFGLGFYSCDPFWGWNAGCGYGLGGAFYDYPPAFDYNGPAEPDYTPVPSDNSPAGDSDEAVLYLKDGTVYLISDYWLANNQIHYVTGDGVEHAIDMDVVDLQQTVDVNAKRGMEFTLKPAPSSDGSNDQSPASQGSPPTLQSPQQ